ncbi:hypothetical protein [Streptomyces sp. 35G-GA-8]|uniref:hypothetical protein n=1 Tax=Streptomyces sp. 35G-GA-8 TaxID=2939434 RepID=UPI00201EDF5E|nr:hypothetical protein [Streptomyces sp. 35G-GA-8]MCL7375278.1 hypothetical protein [Streptomyces sp. 35G-GA-8]
MNESAKTLRPGRRWCVLPDDKGWLRDLRTVGDRLLDHLSAAAALDDDPWELPAAPYAEAATACDRVVSMLPEHAGSGLEPLLSPTGTPQPTVHALAVDSGDLDALWEVLTRLHRALDNEPGTEGLLDLVGQAGAEWGDPPRSPRCLISQLERVVAVLELDTFAVRTLAVVMADGTERTLDETGQTAYEAVTASWATTLQP